MQIDNVEYIWCLRGPYRWHVALSFLLYFKYYIRAFYFYAPTSLVVLSFVHVENSA
jgi:hypothetical protein